jgi:HK97 family phage prohead protease
MKTTRELRFFRSKVELRDLSADEKSAGYLGAIEGYIPYESDSRELRDVKGQRFVERLAPGVFARSLADRVHAIFADVGHNDAATFARRGVNLTLTDSAAGLAYRAIVPDTTVGRDLLTHVRLGIIDGTSFEFELGTVEGKRTGETWAKRAELAVRTITEAILHRVNPVTEPAYLETTLAARGLEEFCAATAAPASTSATISEDAREMRLRILSK